MVVLPGLSRATARRSRAVAGDDEAGARPVGHLGEYYVLHVKARLVQDLAEFVQDNERVAKDRIVAVIMGLLGERADCLVICDDILNLDGDYPVPRGRRQLPSPGQPAIPAR